MFYLIDGYNVFFQMGSFNSFEKDRLSFFEYLSNEMQRLRMQGAVVFDYAHDLATSHPTRFSSDYLEVFFAPEHLDADAYILEFLQSKSPKQPITVVTSDRELIREIKYLEFSVLSSADFLNKLSTKKRRSSDVKQSSDSPQNVRRLLRAFEERYNKDNFS